jgi:glyoxylate/hydroxypyruvate reductase A
MPTPVALYHPTLAGRYLELLAPRHPDLIFLPVTDEDGAAAAMGEAEILLAQISFPGRLLADAPRLGWIQVMGAGADALAPHVPRGVRLSRFTGSLGERMAEYVIAYVLAVTQRLPEVFRHQAARHWQPLALDVARGKTLGVAGLGSVGSAVARLGVALGMTVNGYSRRQPALAAVSRWFPADAFGEFAGASDFVVLALPATPATDHIVNAETLARMRQGAWLINVSRGALVDEAALIAGLRRRRPAGAVLDVFATEPLPPGHPFWTMPNAIVTAHQSGSVIPEEVADLFALNLPRYRLGEPLINEIDQERGY